ncbi:MAG: PH domain-containing protein [Byssovorax sp.]
MTAPAPRPSPALLRVWLTSRPLVWVFVPIFLSLFLTPLLLLFTAQGAGAHVPFLAMGLTTLMFALTVLFVMARVTVGPEGVLIERLGGRRFVPFAIITSAEEVEGRLIRLTLRDGKPVDIYTGREENTGKERYEESCRALLARIQGEVEKRQAGEPQGLSVEALIHRLRVTQRDTTSTESGYREAAGPSREELWEAVEDGRAPAATRAAAGALLGRSAEEGERVKLRIAASGTADPDLRALLERAAEGEQALEEEIEALSRRRVERG